MTSRDFAFWLQGYLEIQAATGADAMGLGPAQTECIARHLALVFKHEIDPSYDGDQAALQAVHDGSLAHAGQPQFGQVLPSGVIARC